MYKIFEHGGKYYHKATDEGGLEYLVLNISDWLDVKDHDPPFPAVCVGPNNKAEKVLWLRCSGGLHRNGVEKVGDLVLTMVRS
jgi:hypothetical protein